MNGNSSENTDPRWQKTPVANLVRHVQSGNYYARIRVRGKLIWKSLKTDRISVAKLRLGDFHKEERKRADAHKAVARGKMTFGAALETYRERLKGDYSLKERSKTFREERITALLKSWPELDQTDVAQISKADCLAWAARFGNTASPSAFNNTVGTFKLVLDIPVEAGARYDNPGTHIKRRKIRQKVLHLPSQDKFPELVATIRKADGAWGRKCADLVEFLAYSGCRKGEAARIEGQHCSFEKAEITVLGDPVTGTKNWEIRRVPMIPDMRRLLDRINSERGEKEFSATPLMRVQECQGAINTACKKLGIARFTHHDLRHLFATRCIESGVDIPTVSRWLGHKDGGALAMKTYGHLRDQHSANMAQKVVFSEPASNVPPLQLNGNGTQNGHVSTTATPEKATVAVAKAKYSYPWWASKNPVEVFWGQLNEDVQIVPLEKFHESAKQAMNREVFPDEFADRESLKEEFIERISKATLVLIKGKIQAKQAEKAA
ncbi:MAG: site-specific integrase [Verrucomicrobia bacterium]|nr:site-specific integrase [Verrucomicrobiota bacterium]